ncbi:hypothetical protein PR048_011497 [Dryococelus australis]|uniref:Uncharacterized protein n=1 Tax=Dryococelus australis TaxID=614101 RepID=A0ABQ9HLQ5_9NEOP|nr:hypothetical protein PR048_011497 [Dryococelus australis]
MPDDMQEQIVAACRGITPETPQAARYSLHVRLQMANGGGTTCCQHLYIGNYDMHKLTCHCGDACMWDNGNPSDGQVVQSAAGSTPVNQFAFMSYNLLCMQRLMHENITISSLAENENTVKENTQRLPQGQSVVPLFQPLLQPCMAAG